MHQTIKELILFRLVQWGECSLMRNISKRRVTWGFIRQVYNGVIHQSHGSHEERWKQLLS